MDKEDQKQKPEEEKENQKNKELDNCLIEKEELLKNWQRERADFINYKKEEAKRLGEINDYSKIYFFMDMINILDHFEMAEKTLNQESKEKPEIIGLLNIKKQIESMLKNKGLEKIECLGGLFDPQIAEAIEEIESDGISQTIIEEIQPGYKFKNKIIRPAKVKIIK
ncbi:MAG TPA: nucleotide exchange factor GrpE [Candidatus Pacearchaeota archaeon]|nr:nucleotide exchange factor GrpE [Candidatus Pacearchaeota archaeon]